MATGLGASSTELLDQGYTLVEGVRTDEDATRVLSGLGTLMPQYDGHLRYQVKFAPGFEGRRYSKSTNTILVHTEAPGWNPPPRYLALHCRVQATCGSGHTQLADAYRFFAELPAAERDDAHNRAVHWVGHNTSGKGSEGIHRPMVERTADGRSTVRFSYNLLTAGHYDPPVDAAVDPEDLPLGTWGRELAERAQAFFKARRKSILIPEDSLLIWDNQRMLHARSSYSDVRRHLTRYWIGDI